MRALRPINRSPVSAVFSWAFKVISTACRSRASRTASVLKAPIALPLARVM